MIDQEDLDARFMSVALSLARRGIGNVWPNPAVGALIVSDGLIAGRGWTQAGGRPHAETEALKRAGDKAKAATAYVSLEPCAHEGGTPPCADALIEAGIARVVLATLDPDRRVSGKGVEALQAADIGVSVGVLEHQAREVNQGFLSRIERGRPYVTLKIASSLDGRTALQNGDSQWITSIAAREDGHRLRAVNDAILVGRGTVAADDPSLTCRLPGLEDRSPVRVVIDSKHRIADDATLLKTTADVPTWIIATEPGPDRGSEIMVVDATEAGQVSPAAALTALGDKGITRVLIEGGSEIAAAFLDADLVDEIVWYGAPGVIGGNGLPAVGALDRPDLAHIGDFRLKEMREIGPDFAVNLVRNSS